MHTISDGLLGVAFRQMQRESEIARELIFWEFKDFYDQNYTEIEKHIKATMLNKPFTKATLDKLIIAHLDIILKTINRKTAGIYTKPPIRKLITGKDAEDENLNALLLSSNYNQQVKEAFKKSEFFNLVAIHVIFRNGKIDLDVITPESFRVSPNEFDFLIADGVIEKKINGKTGEIYSDVWTADENYKIDGAGERKPTGENNEQMKNPYKILPYAFLRKKEGLDFYGEPNWNLLNNQKAIDIKISDNDSAEYFNKYKIAVVTDGDIPTGTKLSPGTMIRIKSVGDRVPTFVVHDFNIDFGVLNGVVNDRIKMTLMSEGIPGSSSSATDNPKQVGAKIIDEMELRESREDVVGRLVPFELKLLKILKAVNDYHSQQPAGDKLKKLKDGKFEVMFQEAKPSETIQDKKLRREYESEFLGKDEIDFVMEDLGMNEKEAIVYIKARSDRAIKPPTEGGSLLDKFKKPASNE